MLLNHVILGVCWGFYCFLHSFLASLPVKQRLQRSVGKQYRYYRLFYTVFAAVSLGALVVFQIALPTSDVFTPTTATKMLGWLVMVAGVGLMIVCIKKYFISLSGLKSLFQEAPAAELMIAGIHRYMRHPLYAGTFLAIWGLWILLPYLSLLLSNSIITLYTLYAIQLEEEKLVAEFGEQYRRYQKAVPKLIPRF
jgi:protein-S-isoprenylcysteine O-methyltransferase Ste14